MKFPKNRIPMIVIILLLGILPTASLAQGSAGDSNAAAAVEPALYDTLTAKGSSDLVVLLAEQADLSGADQIQDWSERGRYVYQKLLEVATRSQAPVIAYAKQQDLKYRSFLSNNAVYLENGDMEALLNLRRISGVAYIRQPQVAQIQPESETAPLKPDAYGWNLDVLDPNSSLYGMQAAQVWQNYNVTGRGIVVANIDTGVYYQHVALDRQYRGNTSGAIGGPYNHNYNWYQPNFMPCGNGTYPCDADGHGTGTVGIMVGETPDLSEQIGIAPDAKWIACQGCDDPPYCTEEALTACADWMLAPCPIGVDPGDPSCDPDLRPQIINNSWGGSGCSTWYQPFVQAWVASGIFPAFSAGNIGGCGTLGSPGDLPESFGTAAHWTDGNNAYAGGPSCFFSNPSCDPQDHQIDPHVNAPTGAWTADYCQSCYFALGGTSGASPHTAGTVALMWSANPGLIGQIDPTFTILEQSANRDRPALTCGQPACAGPNGYPNYDFGWGYLDALSAVQMAGVGGFGNLDGSVTEAMPLEVPGDPLDGVTITAEEANGLLDFNSLTDASGYYTMTLSNGTYTVTADAPLFGPATISGITVITDTVTSLNFQLLPKGRLLGTVTDVETGTPLLATIRTANASPVTSDPTTGNYAIYLGQGSQDVIVEADNYASQTITVNIVSGQDLQQDFALQPALSVSSSPIQVSLELSQTLSASTVLTNNTSTDYVFNFSHIAAAGVVSDLTLVVNEDTFDEPALAMEQALTELGYPFVEVDGTTFYSMTIPEILNFGVVLYTGYPDTDPEQNHIIAYLDAGGRFLISDSSFALFEGTSRLHDLYLQAHFDGIWDWAGVLTGLDIMNGLYPNVSPAIVLYEFTAGPEGTGLFQTANGGLAGIRTERAGYRAMYFTWDYDDIGAPGPGDYEEKAILERAMLWLSGFPLQATWYGTNPSGGTIPGKSSLTWDNLFTATQAAGIDQPGQYYATLKIDPTDPNQTYPRRDVPVVLTALPSPSMGKLVGTITNNRPGNPMQAQVEMEDASGGNWVVTSDWFTGGYGYWLEAGPYTVTVSASGYLTDTSQLTISPGVTRTHDVELVLLAPQIEVTPLVLSEMLLYGQTATQTIQVSNTGVLPLDFTWREHNLGVLPVERSVSSVNGARILFHLGHGGYLSFFNDLISDLTGMGATVDIVSTGIISATLLSNYDVLWIPDILDIPFSYTELDDIQNWVNNGGGLFVNYECCDDSTAPVLTSLFDIIYTGPGGFAGVTNDLVPHLVTQGVSSVFLPHPMQSITVTGTAEIVVFGSGGDPAVAVNEVGNGKVLVMTDGMFIDTFYNQADNTLFAHNVFGWLFGDAEWLMESPIAATVAPGITQPVTITFDAGLVDEPGIYQADLLADSNDPLAPSVAIQVTLAVSPTASMGKIAGTITSDRPGGPLRAQVRLEDNQGRDWTVYTTPGTGDYARWLTAGVYTVTASATGYLNQTVLIDIPAQQTTQLDLELILGSPGIATQPAAVEQTVIWGMTNTLGLTVTNFGLQDLDFNIVEAAVTSRKPNTGPLAYAIDRDGDALVSFFLDSPGSWNVIAPISNNAFIGADFRLNDFSTLWAIHWSMDVLYTIDTATGATSYHTFIGVPYPHMWMDMTAAPDGTLYGVTDYWWGFGDHESYLWTIDTVHGTPTQIGQITNAQAINALAINLAGEMYGVDLMQDVLIQIDPLTAAGTIIGSIGFDAFGSQALDFDDDSGILYFAAYDDVANQGQLRTVDLATGATTLIGAFPGGAMVDGLAIVADGRVDIPWLSENPTSGSVPPLSETGVSLTFDARQVSGPGIYLGNLHLESNDPLNPDHTVPITMTVQAGTDLGQIEGFVSGTGYCDGDFYPLEAQVIVEAGSGITWTVTSDPASGYYSQWVPTGTYTVSVFASQHVTAAAAVQVTAMHTTQQNFDLRLYEPCLTLSPGTFSMTLSVGSRLTQTLLITNSGAADMPWELRETTDPMAIPPLPPYTGEVPRRDEPLSIEPLAATSIDFPNRSGNPTDSTLNPMLGEPASGLDTSNFNLVHIPDTRDPGTWNVLANVGTFYSAGDFWHGDFTKMYALDFYTNEFVTLDMATGDRTLIGIANTPAGHHWTGMTIATDGTIYAVSTECGTASSLFTIDRMTGNATLVGTTFSASCLIDIAINAQDEMYGVDIKDDVLVQIDPHSGAATSIGVLGIDANHAQSLDFEEDSGILYWAAVDYRGHLRRIDTTTGSSTDLGNFPNGTGVDCLAFATGGGEPFWSDVPWLSEVPTSGVILADDSYAVQVAFDTTNLTEGACYTASLGMLHDDPQAASPELVPVNLCAAKPWPVFYLSKRASPEAMLPGDPVTYTLIFGNDGSLETGISISDVLPAKLNYVWSSPLGAYDPAAHTLVWDDLVLDAGSRITATVGTTLDMSVIPGAVITNTVNLLWRSDMYSDWASIQVMTEEEPPSYSLLLPVIIR